MTVLHLGKFYPPARGGMETILELICRRTSHHVTNRVLVASHDGSAGEEQRGAVEIVRLPVLARIGAVSICPALPVRLAAEKADVIFIHEPNPMGLLAYFLARPAGKLIVWFHSEVIRPSLQYRLFYRPLLDFAFARASRIIVASPTLVASSVQLRKWRSKCVVIPYGIEQSRSMDSEATKRRADEIRLEHGHPIVLFVGRLVGYKGVDVLITAMKGLDAVALVAGDGPQRDALRQMAESLGVADRVKFLGEVSDGEVASLYDACDVFVLPSRTRQEAFGVVQLEAMLRGKAVISTDLGTGTGWVNQHGETGFVIPPGDSAALHDAIHQLLTNPSQRAEMGAAGGRRARSLFTADRMIESTLDLYAQITNGHVGCKTVA